ncbi:MAG: hypothetical protein Q9208_002397 [Pyrenodesmia sp. 3 TL-2023]
MVYREVLARDEDVGFGRSNRYWPEDFKSNHRVGARVNKDRINILLVNKQVYEEASQILYNERFFKAQINMYGIDVSGAAFEEDRYAKFIPPKRMSEIRNLEICINTYALFYFRQPCFERMAQKLLLENITVFYYKVASHFQNLKNIIIKLPCHCLWFPPIAQCVTRQECEQMLRPLLGLRASNSVTFQCHQNTANELKEDFDKLTAIFKSPSPVEEVLPFRRACVDLRDKAAPMLRATKDRIPGVELALAFWEANEVLAEDGPFGTRFQEFLRHRVNVETLLLQWRARYGGPIKIETRD